MTRGLLFCLVLFVSVAVCSDVFSKRLRESAYTCCKGKCNSDQLRQLSNDVYTYEQFNGTDASVVEFAKQVLGGLHCKNRSKVSKQHAEPTLKREMTTRDPSDPIIQLNCSSTAHLINRCIVRIGNLFEDSYFDYYQVQSTNLRTNEVLACADCHVDLSCPGCMGRNYDEPTFSYWFFSTVLVNDKSDVQVGDSFGITVTLVSGSESWQTYTEFSYIESNIVDANVSFSCPPYLNITNLSEEIHCNLSFPNYWGWFDPHFEIHAFNVRTGDRLACKSTGSFGCPSQGYIHSNYLYDVAMQAPLATPFMNDTHVMAVVSNGIGYGSLGASYPVYHETSFDLFYQQPPPDVTPPILEYFSIPPVMNLINNQAFEAWFRVSDYSGGIDAVSGVQGIRIYANEVLPYWFFFSKYDEGQNITAFMIFLSSGLEPGVYCLNVEITDMVGNIAYYNSTNFPDTCTTVVWSACPRGQFAPLENLTDCSPCPLGTYMDAAGSISCLNCEPGTESSCGEGSSSCAYCPRGSARYDTPSCEECAPGYYSGQRGSAFCEPCAWGLYSDASGSASCKICPAGTFSAEWTPSVNCTECPAGTFSFPRSSQCFPCLPGSYSPPGSPACLQCPENTYSEGQVEECTPCPSGEVSGVGASECQTQQCNP